jgi:hypothetical protein
LIFFVSNQQLNFKYVFHFNFNYKSIHCYLLTEFWLRALRRVKSEITFTSSSSIKKSRTFYQFSSGLCSLKIHIKHSKSIRPVYSYVTLRWWRTVPHCLLACHSSGVNRAALQMYSSVQPVFSTKSILDY